MKKNYYNLTKEERKDYFIDFKETTVGKELIIGFRFIIGLTCVFGFVAVMILVINAIDVAFGIKSSDTTLISIGISVIAYILSISLYYATKYYVESHFARWLKHEHKIEK